MLAEQQDHRRLLHLGEIFHQLFKGPVALMDQGEVLVHGGKFPLHGPVSQLVRSRPVQGML